MPTELKTLKATLSEWTEIDLAMCAVTELLGLIDFEASPFQTRSKHVFWTAHPVGTMAYDLLEKLVGLGILERRQDETSDTEYRWNPSFRGSWE
jgi:hypothetical protein